MSPRTTRVTMLSTELSESLRRQLVRQRSQSPTAVRAALRRRHTSDDVAGLGGFPALARAASGTDLSAGRRSEFHRRYVPDDFYSKGW